MLFSFITPIFFFPFFLNDGVCFGGMTYKESALSSFIDDMGEIVFAAVLDRFEKDITTTLSSL